MPGEGKLVSAWWLNKRVGHACSRCAGDDDLPVIMAEDKFRRPF